MGTSNGNDFKITEKSQVVNMVDVNTIYGENGDFKSCVDTISNVIIPELERLANSNVIQYGNVGTKPLFDRLIDETNQLVKELSIYASERISDFEAIHDAEHKEYLKGQGGHKDEVL